MEGLGPARGRPLPALRSNLEFLRGAPTPEGVPTWTIADPVRNKYFQIEWPVYQLLQRWSCGTIEKLIETVPQDTTFHVTVEDVEDLITFLYVNNLTEQSATGTAKDFVQQTAAREQRWWRWLLHHYLFLRVPLARPQHMLEVTLPLVEPLYTRAAAWTVGAAGLAGLWLVSRQWDTFASTFLHFFSWSGAVYYAMALCGVKMIHELGHAYTAVRFGCRVPTIGVALVVLMPVLYSDVSDAYRLSSKRKRLWIAAGGVVAECGLAAMATCLWGFLPEGPWRSLAFVVGTTGWITSLAVNLNPLMRFDGYYLLADGLGLLNLQDRAFAFGQWKLREYLFAPGVPPPEPVGAGTRRLLVGYAWATWLYRLIVFTGIAVTIYHYCFKLLGAFLFFVEMLVFIFLPMWRELTMWWSKRAVIARTSRFAITLASAALLLILTMVPWAGRVAIPGVLQASSYATVYPPASGRIVAVSAQAGQQVRAGDPLLTLENPRLAKEAKLVQTQIDLLEFRLRRQAGHGGDRAQGRVLAELLRTKRATLDALIEQQQTLMLRSPIDGFVSERADSLHPGRWLNEQWPVAYVVNRDHTQIAALASSDERAILAVGQGAIFIPDDLTRASASARIVDIREVDEEDVSLSYLASIYGGTVPVRKGVHGRLWPERAVYRVDLDVLDPVEGLDQAVTGQLHVATQARSIAVRLWEAIAAVLIRESGF